MTVEAHLATPGDPAHFRTIVMTVEAHLATPGDPHVPLLPCRLSRGIQLAAMYVLWSQLATPADHMCLCCHVGFLMASMQAAVMYVLRSPCVAVWAFSGQSNELTLSGGEQQCLFNHAQSSQLFIG